MTIAVIIGYFVLVALFTWFFVSKYNKNSYLLKVTCNDLVVLQTELMELEALCDASKDGSVKWQFAPPSGTEEPNKVVVQVIHYD